MHDKALCCANLYLVTGRFTVPNGTGVLILDACQQLRPLGISSNEKYAGNVRFLDDGKHDAHYLAQDNNPIIISKETFQAVRIEKQHRNNVEKGENGNRRKSKKYSSKK